MKDSRTHIHQIRLFRMCRHRGCVAVMNCLLVSTYIAGILLRKINFPEDLVYNVCRMFWIHISEGTFIVRQLKLEGINSTCTLRPLGLRLRCGMVACVVNSLY